MTRLLRFIRVAGLVFCTVGVWECGFSGANESILDQVSSSPEVRKKLIEDYQSNPASFSGDRLLAVGIGYIEDDLFAKAQPIYERFLRDHPNHLRALRGLGTVHYYQEHYDEAIKSYRKAWSLGDTVSLGPLAGTYVNRRRYAEMEDRIPALQQHADGDPVVVNSLISYAIYYKEPPDVKLVLKALAGLRDEDIFLRDDTTLLISEVLARFGRSPELELAQAPIILKVIRGYEANPKKWPANRRTQAADCYCLAGKPSKAEPIYREVLKDSLDEVDALRGLGITLAYQHKFKEGIDPLRKAWDKGDKLSLSALAACHLGARDFGGMKDLIPRLLECRKDDFESLNAVIAYALGKPSPDRELFFKAIDGISDDQLLRNEEVAHNTILGLKLFGEKKRAEQLQKLKAEQARGKKA